MSDTARLFAYIAGYSLITFVVYLACNWMVRIDERRGRRS